MDLHTPPGSSLTELLKRMEEQGIDQDNPVRQRMFVNMLNQKASSRAVPQQGIFELTPRCNFDCKMCYVHLEEEQMKHAKELPGSVWISLIDEAVKNGMLKAQLTGGEAMLHPDFDEIYLYLHNKGIWISLLSNGFLLNRQRVEFLKLYPPRSLQVSLYGSDNTSYQRLTGRAVFDRVKENILLAKEIRTNFVLAVTPNRYFPLEEVERALEFAKKEKIKIRINKDLMDPYEETGRELAGLEFSEDDYFQVRRMLCAFNDVKVQAFKGELPEPVWTAAPGKGVACAAGRTMFAVNWRGEMRACLDLPFKAYPLEDGFQKAWAYIHERAVNYPFPGECLSCTYSGICTVCPVIHAKGGEPGHSDKKICRRTLRLVREGLVKLGE